MTNAALPLLCSKFVFADADQLEMLIRRGLTKTFGTAVIAAHPMIQRPGRVKGLHPKTD